MKIINDIIQRVNLIKKIKEAGSTDLVFCVQGANIGEKILSVYSLNVPVIVVAKNVIEMNEYRDGFLSLGEDVCEIYTETNPPLFSQIQNMNYKQNLIKSLYDFALGKTRIMLVSEDSLLFKFPKKINIENVIKLDKNNDYKLKEITEKLIRNGYKKCQKIEKVGDFSIRGDILDVFLCNYENPIRLDFFGETLEKIYSFDLLEMKKVDELDRVLIYPNVLYSISQDEKEEIIKTMKLSLINGTAQGDALIKNHTLVNQIEEYLNNNLISSDTDFLKPFLKTEYSIINLFSDFAKIVIDEPKRLFDDLSGIYKSASASLYDFISSGDLLEIHSNTFFKPNDALNFKPNLVFSNLNNNVFKCDVTDTVRTIGSRKYVFDYKSLVNDLFIYERSKYKVILFAGSENSRSSISEYLSKYGIFTSEEINFASNKFQVIVREEKFNKSCSFLDAGIIIVGTDDLIKKTKADTRKLSSGTKKKNVFYLPKVGDYVVHETHGIGKCISLDKINFNGTEKDYFVIEYQGGDKLYLPSEQANLISAYVCGDLNPKLNKIGGEQFAKIKQKVQESVNKLAINLLEIYSKREKTKGFVYSKDNYLFEEFENAFPHEETEDQTLAIADIKADMEGTKIMDRLICGDVGYGKTEVALRAIYKAVIDGKQVAFLCPTTILSQQHYQTAKERFNGFMVNVAVLNRFKTKTQQEQILKDLKEGKVDVIIGTHRLLSDDVKFKDLGLLVLDEEQRFGVKDKEKIKSIKQNIDVLTLSATPIPRTLNMALTGIRDISIITTPPKERIAIQTFVNEESDSLILDACKREFARGGQVLYVYNRVEHIYEQAERLRNLLPDARIGVAHGQMPERLLEETIMQLYNREFDILVATTLIESGIDLPLANTLIVIDADRLGLSELYQLRGRIGRSDRVAYAYFTYNPAKVLTSDAYKRLDAIMEFTELGSGFKIAMRDLEIRGAGNILGKEQSGHLEKVGYDMYCKLLENAVKELKGEKIENAKAIKMDIIASANISEKYIESEEERIKWYSEISEISTDEQLNVVYENLKNMYGEIPKETERLLKIAYIKNLGVKNNIKRIFINASNCMLYVYKTNEILPKNLSKALSETQNGVLKFEDVPIISFDFNIASIDDKINFVLNFFNKAN